MDRGVSTSPEGEDVPLIDQETGSGTRAASNHGASVSQAAGVTVTVSARTPQLLCSITNCPHVSVESVIDLFLEQ